MHRKLMTGGALALVLLTPPLFAQAPQEDPEVYFSTGQMHQRDGRLDMAIEQYRKALKIEPRHVYALKGMGIAYMQLRRYNESIEAFRIALQHHPYYPDVHNDLGTVLLLAGRREEGKQELLTAFNDPTYNAQEMAARNLGQAYLEEGNAAEAVTWFRSAVARNKTYVDAHLGLAEALRQSAGAGEAVVALEAGRREVPRSATIALSLARMYLETGRIAEARRQLDEAGVLDPSGETGHAARELLQNLPPAR